MKRQPERSCVGCRERAPKSSLLRVVRRPEGTVAVDRDGRQPGRGGYVHRDMDCVEAAARRGGLSRVLRVPLQADDLATLRSEIEKELQ